MADLEVAMLGSTGRSSSRRELTGLALACLLVFAACQPITHATIRVREGVSSGTTFRLLSGSGRFVVVTSTGRSATVPDAGMWRVDRRTGAAIRLPGTGVPSRISADGRRILLGDGTLWSVGAVYTPPAAAVFSPDLTAVAYLGPDGGIASRLLPDGPVWAVETGHPRPADSTGVSAAGVSDDGRTVEYVLNGPMRVVRFVDLNVGSAVDRTDGSFEVDIAGYRHDWFVLSADGRRFAQLHEDGQDDFIPGFPVILVSWVEVVDTRTGTVITHGDTNNGTRTVQLRIGAFGDVAWVYQEQPAYRAVECLGLISCVTSSVVVAIEVKGVHVYQLGPGYMRTVNESRNGRFLLVSKERTLFSYGRRVTVVDWKAGTNQQLPSSAETYTEPDVLPCRFAGSPSAPCTIGTYSTNGQISDDGSLVATQSGTQSAGIDLTGWYEFNSP